MRLNIKADTSVLSDSWFSFNRMTKIPLFKVSIAIILAILLLMIFKHKFKKEMIIFVQSPTSSKGTGVQETSPRDSDKPNESPIPNTPTSTTKALGVPAYEDMFDQYMKEKDVKCNQSQRVGDAREGGWNMCVDPAFLPKKPCLIYSFGINNQWNFDDQCDKRYGCVHRAFDPSMRVTNHKRGSHILFYAEGLAGKTYYAENNLWKLNTLADFLKIFNETQTVVDYLKIDIEYWEWESLATALKDGSLKNVKQLGIEYHRDELFKKSTTLENYKLFMSVFKGLRENGFLKWDTHYNPQSFIVKSPYSNRGIGCCYEVIYINSNFF